ncbi:hypothetical protein [Shewanella algae]|uniref:hypothetical protein n=1 Tax=Shewanella algae TaxID=38313 RepID=UPI001AAE078E|nr:hypothetical protein [Shewanella algae]MBO2558967.1 hypothetical protein [Shewanella algae]MBO2575880.1 hypothetical protein [Shewanella algae]
MEKPQTKNGIEIYLSTAGEIKTAFDDVLGRLSAIMATIIGFGISAFVFFGGEPFLPYQQELFTGEDALQAIIFLILGFIIYGAIIKLLILIILQAVYSRITEKLVLKGIGSEKRK